MGALVGCSATTVSPTGSSSAAASGNTSLKAGTYDATFTSAQSGPGGGGGSQRWSGAYIVNGITLTDSTLTSTGTAGMMIYQSFSGDAANSDATSSKATMTITNSTITTSGSVPMIYVTNTTCDVKVTGATLTHPASTPLLSLAEDRWGTSGSNGGHATVTFAGCTLTGAMTAVPRVPRRSP